MWIAVVSTTAAIAMFTWTKWEVERRLKELPDADREAWMAGDYKEYKEKQLKMASLKVEESSEGFEASHMFDGYRQGMVYKAGVAGLGYYPDHYGDKLAALEVADQ